MTLTVPQLNALSPADAADAFRACCGASRWIDAMVVRGPYDSMNAVLETADDVWSALGPDDWREAFAHHPRIGERTAAVAQDRRAAEWSSTEQSAVAAADAAHQQQLAQVNRAYEAKFGYIYIVCAAGRTADELLDIARRRLANAPDDELRIAAEEQRQITRLRLTRLLSPTP